MANFFTENSDMKFHLTNRELMRITELKEDGFSQKETFAEAPTDYPDALDNYNRVLSVIGEIAADYIAPSAADVDKEGILYNDGNVSLNSGTEKSLNYLRQAGVMGFTQPRNYGGLNFPKVIYSMAIELIARADASLMTFFGLQEIAETIHKFGTEEQKEKYLPRFCRGETSGAMALTEPDAGSDLPSIKLKAFQDEENNWKLSGVKRFITNGCGNIVLVVARSESNIEDARGLSLFIYEREENMRVRGIEEKLGIHGSPTCELQFNNAPAELLGQRKRGLIKYTMSLMNGARLAIAAQALGLMEAAYSEARNFSMKRVQFGSTIDSFPQIIELLSDMRVDIEAARTLLYEASRIVDIREGLEKTVDKSPELKKELRRYTQYEQLFTPLIKYHSSELGNRICYDAMQIHGGVGYMKEYAIERIYRDMRITSIYEGTSQVQIIAANGAVVRNLVSNRVSEYEEQYDFSSMPELFKKIKTFKELQEKAVLHVQVKGDSTFMDFHAVRLVKISTDTLAAYLLCIDALRNDRKKKIAALFIEKAQFRITSDVNYILSEDNCLIESGKEVIG